MVKKILWAPQMSPVPLFAWQFLQKCLDFFIFDNFGHVCQVRFTWLKDFGVVFDIFAPYVQIAGESLVENRPEAERGWLDNRPSLLS